MLTYLKEFRGKKNKFSIINLGCARNTVDSEIILGQIQAQGHSIVELDKADVVIVNTCGFIEDAKKESIDVILDLIERKNQGKIKQIIVAGCLSERYGKILEKEFKEVDNIVGVLPLDQKVVPEKFFLTPRHSTYVKICESCYNKCSFCAIPLIKGKFISRKFESIIKEVKDLDEEGVKEINIIGQDITAYGLDLYKRKRLAELLSMISRTVSNIKWIRLLYTFPSHITDELIEVIAREERVCKYIDMPLQHINDRILKEMNRGIDKDKTLKLIKKIREKIPKVQLRTSLIVGFPGETEKEFKELLSFIKETRFDKLGAFMYSREEGTKAFNLKSQISEKIKKQRYGELMRLQKGISSDLKKQYIGQKMQVLIDEKDKNNDNIYIGRTEYDAPEVDGVVYIKSRHKLHCRDFVYPTITDTLEYDLAGEVK